MTKHSYRAFGLNFISDFLLPALAKNSAGQADVTIFHSEIGDHLDEDWFKTAQKYKNWEASPGRFLMRVEGVADYLVKDGKEIWIERQEGVGDDAVIAYLMGSAMAALLQQRKLLTLHGSAIQFGEGAVLFVGQSGAGKSTLLSRMLHDGHAMITDDVAAISMDDPDAPLLLPAFPTTRLWKDTLEKLAIEEKAERKVRAELEKFLVTADNFCPEPLPIKMIFVLGTSNQPEIEIKPIKPSNRFSNLDEHSFRKGYMKGNGLQKHHFQSLAQLAKSVPMLRVTRPAHPFLLDELAEAVTAQMMLSEQNKK